MNLRAMTDRLLRRTAKDVPNADAYRAMRRIRARQVGVTWSDVEWHQTVQWPIVLKREKLLCGGKTHDSDVYFGGGFVIKGVALIDGIAASGGSGGSGAGI